MPINDAKTPNGLPCWIAGKELASLIREQSMGVFQDGVVNHLIEYGYVIEYCADGSMLKGKAKSYNSHYMKSVRNLMDRIENNLPGTLRIKKGPVGPKGGFGYRLVI